VKTSRAQENGGYSQFRVTCDSGGQKGGLGKVFRLQMEVDRRIGQPPSYIGKIENGMRGVSVAEMVQIAKAIGVDPRKIITELLKAWRESPPPEAEGPVSRDSA
jgi:hypothetical protein